MNWSHALSAFLVIISAVTPGVAPAAEVRRRPFGALADGRAVEAVTLINASGMSVTLLSYGAIIQALSAPDRAGKLADVVLGYADLKDYIEAPNYFGATVGRYANRIRDGRFTLDGRSHALALNDRGNTLHGGNEGFDKKLWTIERVAGGAEASVTFTYVSPNGEEGYPGALTVRATYSLNERNELSIDYRATTDRPTIVNITNHSFFNLAGEAAGRDVYDHLLTIPAEMTTPVDATLIPTGAFRPVADTPLDFRRPMAIGARIRDARDPQILFGRGYDENYVIARTPGAALRLQARVEEPESGRVLEILSNQPGVQFYSGNFLDGTAIGKSGLAYRQGGGLALEPQLFPDTPNQAAFGSARLDPGQTYRNIIVYRFSTSESDGRDGG